MINIKNIVLLALISSLPIVSYAAGDAAAGKSKSTTCAACHGADGISATDIWPNLAGQKSGYLVKQMKAFRDGGRKDPSMSPMASQLSDEDIADLAAYYSGL
jgi:cytochrome c553